MVKGKSSFTKCNPIFYTVFFHHFSYKYNPIFYTVFHHFGGVF